MGKQIRIYLADGSPSGIRHAEITNWTGQAIACPRSRFQDLREWKEVKRPGVYFLFGHDDETGTEAAYIGEAEVVIERLANHISGKDFWSELVVFTNKDENLTKGHIKYLESRLLQLAIKAGRYKVFNSVEPQLPSLPRPDRDAMEEYLDSARTLLSVLGHRLLDPLILPSKLIILSSESQIDVAQNAELISQSELITNNEVPVFRLNVSDLSCKGMRTDEGFVVLEESEAALVSKQSLTGGYNNLREQLIQQKILIPSGNKLKFAKNQLFNSPTQAAAIIVGYSINGRDAWRLPNGITFSAYETQLSEHLLSELSETSGETS